MHYECANGVGMTRIRRRSSKIKAPLAVLSEEQRRRYAAKFADDVLAKLTEAFIDVQEIEGWGKRDIAQILERDETAIGHLLSGRRKNMTIETVALLARAMRKRPELVLKDLRGQGNGAGTKSVAQSMLSRAEQPTTTAGTASIELGVLHRDPQADMSR